MCMRTMQLDRVDAALNGGDGRLDAQAIGFFN